MDILLIFPSLTVDERYGKRGLGRVGGDPPPLGIAQLASYLDRRGFSAGIIDAVALGMCEDDVLEEIRRNLRFTGSPMISPVMCVPPPSRDTSRSRWPSFRARTSGQYPH